MKQMYATSKRDASTMVRSRDKYTGASRHTQETYMPCMVVYEVSRFQMYAIGKGNAKTRVSEEINEKPSFDRWLTLDILYSVCKGDAVISRDQNDIQRGKSSFFLRLWFEDGCYTYRS